MNESRFQEITSRYSKLRLAVLGDFCLDRYLEIDPAKSEISIETGLEVFNVANVRSQPGGAGTILNNLVALGLKDIFPIGFCGEDGEGFELIAALSKISGVRLEHFQQTHERRTFTYCKPLILEPGKSPRELNRLDSKNWTPTPAAVADSIIASFEAAADFADGFIIMDQVDVPETGVVTGKVLEAIRRKSNVDPRHLMIADSRRGLRGFPSVCLKMNERELAALSGAPVNSLAEIKAAAAALANHQARQVFITLAERGIVGAEPGNLVEHAPAFPVRGEIDIVGAGDAVTANLTAALVAGATLREALELAMAAASIVIHQLGTTGTATIANLQALLFPKADN
jgi:rfaE bifunctional protein kinase chain/domain